MSTVKATNFQHASSATANMVTDASGNVTFGGSAAMSSSFLRNRIINGDMRVDQRNAGASITANDDVFPLDRWKFGMTQSSKGTSQRSTTAPTGFVNSLLFTSSSAYSVLSSDSFTVTQSVEGLNISDLSFGTVSASTVTLSFWVRSSLTGSFGVVIQNSAQNRSYPILYTISVANTWEQKSITISGDTTGTWLTTNGIGMRVIFGLGVGSTYNGTSGSWSSSLITGVTGATSVVGTSGATFYVTGVQLEVGTVATPFERQIYSNQFAQCMRYYIDARQSTTGSTLGMTGNITNGTNYHFSFSYPVPMRTSPTLTWVEWTSSGFPGTSALFQQTGYLGSNVYKNANATISGGYFLGGYTASAEL